MIRGERLYLRPVCLSDVTDYYIRWMNDPEVNRFMETRFKTWTEMNVKDYVSQRLADEDGWFFAICRKDDDTFSSTYRLYEGGPLLQRSSHIGNIKLGPVNWIHRRADISLFIGEKQLWGKGYATEAIKLITDFAFKTLNLHKVSAGVYKENLGSFKAFEKNGFQLEGILKGEVYCGGKWTDLWRIGKVNV